MALSRAPEGLYIFGTAENLSCRRVLRSIIEELDAQDALGSALLVACHGHRDKVEYVASPGQLSRVAPDGKCYQSSLFTVQLLREHAGGCMEQCDTLLKLVVSVQLNRSRNSVSLQRS